MFFFNQGVKQCTGDGLGEWQTGTCSIIVELQIGDEVYAIGADEGSNNGGIRGAGRSGFLGYVLKAL